MEIKKKNYKKKDFPVERIREYLEPGPIVLVSSHWRGKQNIMTMGWHTVMEFSPSLVGCVISEANHSFEMIKKSKECVINLPEVELARIVVGIGNCSGALVDKFQKFNLTAEVSELVKAPRIKECHSHFECRLLDARLVKKYNFFIFQVVKAEVAKTPRFPETIHYRGKGEFMVSGRSLKLPSRV